MEKIEISPDKKKIIKNTLLSYTRTLLGAALALMGTRWVLSALGEYNLGLYTMLSSLMIFVTLLNQVLSYGGARQFAFTLGEKPQDLGHWFNASLSLHLILDFILVLFGGVVGHLVIEVTLRTSPEVLETSHQVFSILLTYSAITMICVPYSAMFIAKQKIGEQAWWGMGQAVLGFMLAMNLSLFGPHALLAYAWGQGAILVLYQFAIVIRAHSLFPETRLSLRHWYDRQKIQELIRFSGWSILNNVGVALRNQGSAILLGTHFGPAVTSAYGIANQVSSQANNLTASLVAAIAPSVNLAAGQGGIEKVRNSSTVTSVVGALMTMSFVLPLSIEMPLVLKIWLGRSFEIAAVFCNIVMATYLIDRLTTGIQISISAIGKIAAYQIWTGLLVVSSFPLLAVLFWCGAGPEALAVSFLSSIIAVTLSRLYWGSKLVGLSATIWFRRVLVPCVGAMAVATSLGLVIHFSLAPTVWRVLLVGLSTTMIICSFGFFWYRSYRRPTTTASRG